MKRSKRVLRQIEKKKFRESKLVARMIRIFCKQKHDQDQELCPSCQGLLDYALTRTKKCPFTKTKTFCSSCHVHCYEPEMREKIRIVMRYSGPRIFFKYPWTTILHLIDSRRHTS